MDILSELKVVARKNGGIITTRKAEESGISRATLSSLTADKKSKELLTVSM